VNSWDEETRAYFLNNAFLINNNPITYSGVLPNEKSDGGERMNHSCSPTCAFNDNDDIMVALCDIPVGGEVTYEYVTSETEDSSHVPFNCNCRSANCRGVISGSDWRNPVLQEKYKGYFYSSVKKAIADLHATNSA
jgi:SET domain-containing protein